MPNELIQQKPQKSRPAFQFQYTIDDLTHYLSAGKTTIKSWIEEGLLHAYQITKGGIVFVAHPDVIAFVQRHRELVNCCNLEINTKD